MKKKPKKNRKAQKGKKGKKILKLKNSKKSKKIHKKSKTIYEKILKPFSGDKALLFPKRVHKSSHRGDCRKAKPLVT